MRGKDLKFSQFRNCCLVVGLLVWPCVTLSNPQDTTPSELAKAFDQSIERANCLENQVSCKHVLPTLPSLGDMSTMDALERAYWAHRYFDEGKPHDAYLALLQLPRAWWRLSSFRTMEIILLDQLGLGQGIHGLQLFGGPLLTRVNGWVDNIVAKIVLSSSWQMAKAAWTHRHQSVENLVSLVRTELKAKSIEQSVRQALRSRNPSLALERLATIEDNPVLPCWWWYLKTKALRNQRHWAKAQVVLEKGVTACKAHEPSHPWLLLLGTRIHTVRGDRKAAFKLVKTLKRLYPHHRLYDDAVYRLIRLLLSEKGGLDDAYRLAADHIDRRTVADRIDDAIFQVTLSLMNQGRCCLLYTSPSPRD